MKTHLIIILAILGLILTPAASAETYSQTNTSYTENVRLSQLFDSADVNSMNLTITPAVTKTSPYDIPTDSLRAWYKFDEGTGSAIIDSSGNGYNGSASGGMSWTTGLYNGAGSFDGSDDGVVIPSAAFHPGTGSYTLSWVSSYPHAAGGNAPLIHNGWGTSASVANSFGISAIGANNDSLRYQEINSTTGSYATSVTLESNVTAGIHKFILIRDVENDLLKFYDNGILVKSVAYTTDTNLNSTQNLTVMGDVTRGHHAGTFDNLVVYNKALSGSEFNEFMYDPVKDLSFKLNSDSTYSANVSMSSRNATLPVSSSDGLVSYLIPRIPTSVTINSVAIYNYTATISTGNITVNVDHDSGIIEKTGKVAILIDPDQYDNSTYLNDTSRTRATLDYFGIKYDVLPYNADILELAEYNEAIAICPDTKVRSDALQAYCDGTFRWVAVLHKPYQEFETLHGLTVNANVSKTVGTFTTGISSNLLADGISKIYYSDYIDYTVASGTTAEWACVTLAPESDHLLLATQNSLGKAVFFNYVTSQNGDLDNRLIRNFVFYAEPDKAVITGSCPYASNYAILMRYDDLGTNIPLTSYASYYALSKECTFAGPASKMNASIYNMFREADIIPHSYDHYDLTSLDSANLNYQISAASGVYTNLSGVNPVGFVAPFNYISQTVTERLWQNGYKYLLASGSTGELRYLCTKEHPENNMYVFGFMQATDSGYLMNPTATSATGRQTHAVFTIHTEGIDLVQGLVTNMTQHEGWYFSRATDYVNFLNAAKGIRVNDSQIIVSGGPSTAGLVLYKRGHTSNAVIDGKIATTMTRTDKTMLPALSVGRHTYSYSDAYPSIAGYTNGSLINNSYYNISSKKLLMSIHDDDEVYTHTDVSFTNIKAMKAVSPTGSTIGYYYSNDGNITLTGLVEGTYEITNIPLSVNSDDVTTTVTSWSSTRKNWTESSSTVQPVTHVIGDLPSKSQVWIYRDGVAYERATVNSTGYITWTYSGGYSTHAFSIATGHDFTASPSVGAAPLGVQFIDISGASTASYWDFENDGKVDSTKKNPSHVYGKKGKYTVNLTTTDANGTYSTIKTELINVTSPSFASDPVAWFSYVLGYISSFYIGFWGVNN